MYLEYKVLFSLQSRQYRVTSVQSYGESSVLSLLSARFKVQGFQGSRFKVSNRHTIKIKVQGFTQVLLNDPVTDDFIN